jgi:hypothetical protein
LKAISASDDGEEEESAAGWSHDDLEEDLFLSESPPQPLAEIKPVEVTENTQLPDMNVEDTKTQLPEMTEPNDTQIPAMQNVMEAPPSTGNTALLQQMEAQPLPEMEAQETSNKCNQSHYEFYDACQSEPPTPAHSTFMPSSPPPELPVRIVLEEDIDIASSLEVQPAVLSTEMSLPPPPPPPPLTSIPPTDNHNNESQNEIMTNEEVKQFYDRDPSNSSLMVEDLTPPPSTDLEEEAVEEEEQTAILSMEEDNLTTLLPTAVENENEVQQSNLMYSTPTEENQTVNLVPEEKRRYTRDVC